MSIEIKLWPLSREIAQENPPEILQTWPGKLRIKLSFAVFYKTAPPLAFPPKSFSPVPMEILMTVILDKKPLLLKSVSSILIFHLKNFPPILSLFCILLSVGYSGSSPTHSVFCCKITIGNNNYFSKFIITKQSTCLLFLLGHSPGILKWNLFPEWANLKSTEIDKRNPKQNHIWLLVSANHNPTSNSISLLL